MPRTAVPSETKLMEQLRETLALLEKHHKIASVVVCAGQFGRTVLGNETLTQKMRADLSADFLNDETGEWDTLLHQATSDLIKKENIENNLVVRLPPKLSFPLHLLNLRELGSYLGDRMLEEYRRNGGKLKSVHWQNPNFKPSFWPEKALPFESVKNPSQYDSKLFPKELKSRFRNLTEFLKSVVKHYFKTLDIDHREWVVPDPNEQKIKDRLRARKKNRLDESLEDLNESDFEIDGVVKSPSVPDSNLYSNSVDICIVNNLHF